MGYGVGDNGNGSNLEVSPRRLQYKKNKTCRVGNNIKDTLTVFTCQMRNIRNKKYTRKTITKKKNYNNKTTQIFHYLLR